MSVERQLAELDGSPLRSLLIRRAILRVTAPLSAEHPARDKIDIHVGNLAFAGDYAVDGDTADLVPELIRQWQAIREAIVAARH